MHAGTWMRREWCEAIFFLLVQVLLLEGVLALTLPLKDTSNASVMTSRFSPFEASK